jgi:hypothetical protein
VTLQIVSLSLTVTTALPGVAAGVNTTTDDASVHSLRWAGGAQNRTVSGEFLHSVLDRAPTIV